MNICDHCGQVIIKDEAEATALNGAVRVTASNIFIGDKTLSTTPQESHLLEALCRSRQTFLSKENILNFMMQRRGFPVDEPEMKIVDVIVCKVRRKMAAAGIKDVELFTRWGVGYGLRLAEGDIAPPAAVMTGERLKREERIAAREAANV